MTEGIRKNEPKAREVYGDIIDHPHWQSPTRPHMSLYDRAAQFAPFAALTGYDDMVNEEARTVDRKIELDENSLERLNQKLNLVNDIIRDGIRPTLSITYFVPDPLKAGGQYETVTEEIKKIDVIRGKIVLMKTEGYGKINVEINIPDILEIRGELVDYLDDMME